MNNGRLVAIAAAVSLTALVQCGCTKTQAQVAPAEAPAIPVAYPAQRDVTDFRDFTGQTAAVQSVTIVPRVTGYLVKEPFTEGAEVKAGDLLFEIDPRPYQAQLDQAQGQVILNQARLKEAQADNARAKALSKTPGAISEQDLDRYQAAQEEADAALAASKASLEVYKLNLSFCHVTSPIDGQVSRYFMTPGNLVNQDQTQLTTVVSLDPMYVYFEMDEVTFEVVRKAINEGRIKPYEHNQVPVFVGLQNEQGKYPHKGTINFVNNQFTSTTGSITVRGVVQNPLPPGERRTFAPGMFARVHLPIGQPYKALLVIDRAISSDQGLKYVYTMDPKTNKIQQKTVVTGALEDDGLRVIEPSENGLKADDWVVVGAIQQVRPRMEIRPDHLKEMPSLGPAASSESTAAPNSSPGKTGGDKASSDKAAGDKASGETTPAGK